MEKLEFRGFDVKKHYSFLFNAHKETYKITFGREIDEEFFLKELTYEKENGIGAYLKDELIGICDLQTRKIENCEYGWVHFIYLLPKYRGTGFSSQLINYAREYCRKKGLKFIGLRTGKDNKAAQRFYEREGFKREPLFDRGVEIGYKLNISTD